MDSHMKRALGALIPPSSFLKASDESLALLGDNPFGNSPGATPLITPKPDGQPSLNPFDSTGSALTTPSERVTVASPFDSLVSQLAQQKLDKHSAIED